VPIPFIFEVVQPVVTANLSKVSGARLVGSVRKVMNPLVDESGDGEKEDPRSGVGESRH